MKKKLSVFLFIFACLGMLFVPTYKNSNIYAAGLFDVVFGTPEPAIGDYVNNLVVVNFGGENSLDTYAENTYDMFNTAYNTSTNSLNKFYNTASNSKLNLTTNLISDDNTIINTINIDEEREYFMNYYFRDSSNNWVKNEKGYFKYELLESSKAPEGDVDIQFYINSTHKYFVYDDSDGAPYDDDASDGIISLSYAKTLASSNSKYYVVEGYERYLRELKLTKLISLQVQDYIDFDKADANNDGNLDILSINVLDNPDKPYKIEWSELLWAHQATMGFLFSTEVINGLSIDSVVAQGGFMLNLAKNLFTSYITSHCYNKEEVSTYIQYIFDRPFVTDGTTYLYLDKYYLTTLDGEDLSTVTNDNVCAKLNIGTTAHELGHLFGLPDLYLYSNNSSEATSVWSLMCSSGNPPQYFTAYERYQLGWLDTTNNIKPITSSGDYTVNVTKGYDGTNTVAFVVQGTGDYTDQYFYFEYRNKNLEENYFEVNLGDPGLICYRIDSSVVTGNMYAKPYGLYVFSENGKADKSSSLMLDESFGNLDIRSTDKAITYQQEIDDEVSYVNAGIYVEVKSVSDTQLTFSIKLVEKDHTDPQISIVNGNKELLIGEQYTEDGIKVMEGGTEVTYTLSTDLSGLRQYKVQYYVADQTFNVQGDPISEILTTESGYYIAKYTIVDGYGYEYTILRQITVKKPKIEITDLDKNLEQALKNFTGLTTLYSDSLVEYDFINLANCNLTTIEGVDQFEYSENAIIDLSCNNITSYSEIVSFANILGKNNKISVVYNSLKLVDYNSNSDNSKIIFGFQKENSNYYKMVSYPINTSIKPTNYADDYSDFYNLYVNNVAVSSFSAISGITYGENVYELRAKGNLANVSYSVCYVAFNQVKTTDTTAFETAYNFVLSDWISIYGATENDFEISNTILSIDYSKVGSHAFTITIKVDENQTFEANCSIVVEGSRTIVENIDYTLRQRILEITSQTVPYADILQSYDYINLSNLGLSSLNGLEKFILKENVVIDFSNNNVDFATGVSEFLSKISVSVKILLVGNKLSSEEIAKIPSSVVIGIQTLPRYVVKNTNTLSEILPITFDFDGYYDLYINNNLITGKNVEVNDFDNYEVELRSSKYIGVSQTISYISIYKNSSQTIQIGYNDEVLDINYDDYFTFINITKDQLTITSNFADIDKTQKTGTLEFVFSVDNEELTTISYDVEIVDNDKPVITLNGDKVVYVTSKQMYDELYANDTYNAYDEKDGECIVEVNVPDMSNYGVYEVLYTAQDNDGNTETLVRTVYVGNVTLGNISEVEYRIKTTLPLEYTVFDEDDFVVSYKVGDAEFMTYDSQNGIILSQYGEQTLTVKATHKQKTTFVLQFEKQIIIKDTILPELSLVGGLETNVNLGSEYIELGFTVVDNSKDDEIIKTIIITNSNGDVVESINTSIAGEYTVRYVAQDRGENVSTITRKVIVRYEPIEEIIILEPTDASYVVNKEILLKINIRNGEHSNPNPQVAWYVNDQLIEITSALSRSFTFDKAGTYYVKAIVIGEGVESEVIYLNVGTGSQNLSNSLPFIVGGVVIAVAIIGFVIASIVRKRNSVI